MIQVKEVCIRFTKMMITVLFLAYLNLLKNCWIALLRCPLDKKACRVHSFFFFTCLANRLLLCTYVSMSTVLGNRQCGKKISFSKWLLTVLFVLPYKVNGRLATSRPLIISLRRAKRASMRSCSDRVSKEVTRSTCFTWMDLNDTINSHGKNWLT